MGGRGIDSVLSPQGINVWCTAGKGTFGTDELVERIESSELSKYLSHKVAQIRKTSSCKEEGKSFHRPLTRHCLCRAR